MFVVSSSTIYIFQIYKSQMSVLSLSISRNTLCLSRRVTDWLSSLHKMNDIIFQKKKSRMLLHCYLVRQILLPALPQRGLVNQLHSSASRLSVLLVFRLPGRRFTVYTGGRDGTGGGRPLAGEWLTHWLRLRGRARYYVVLLTITTSHSLTLYSDTACHRADTFAFYIEEIIDRYAYYNVLANRHYGVKRFSTQT